MSLLPIPPRTQALSSTAFVPPPLDGSLDLQEVFDWHLEHNPDHRLFVFYDHSAGALRYLTWSETVKAVHRAVRLIREQVSWTSEPSSLPVVGILAVSDTVTYFTMLLSVLRSNCVVFPISIRNSPTAIAHLLQQVRVKYLLVSGDRAMQQLAIQSFSLLEKDYAIPKVLPFPSFQDLYLSTHSVNPQDIPYERGGPDQIVLYIHSSGSTAHPKPIGYTNLNNLQSMHIPWYGEVDLTSRVISVHAVAMFHVMGVVQLPSAASCGYTLAVFDPAKPTPAPTPVTVFAELQATNCDYVVCVPAFPEAWSKDTDKVRWLSSSSGVICGGGGFNYDIGQYLRSQGVEIIPLYGSTETGAISIFMPEACPEFEYFRLAAYISPHFIAQGHDDAFELVLKTGTVVSPVVLNTKVDNVGAYATSDLLQPHPTRPGFWRVFGRRDDQIMHSTGEKTNAGPLESILNQDRNVLSCVIFGRGKPQAGVLVDPIPTLSVDPTDIAALENFRTKIWPTVQRMNEYAPQHSRIFKEMIIVASPSKPFTYTAKNTARRSAVIADYEEEIEAVFLAPAHIVPPTEWTEESALIFVRSVIFSIMDKALPDEVDIFEHGCDSLQASRILNTLSESLANSLGKHTSTLDRDLVYVHPSTTRLATAIIEHIAGVSRAIVGDERLSLMRALLEAESLSMCSPSRRIADVVPAPLEEHVVLITGTTGALGSYILSELIKDATVKTIYALNRASGEQELNERQRRAFESRGLNPLLLHTGKVLLLEGTLASEQLGLSQEVYSAIKSSLTHIIHNAWPVNFRHTLLSFESSIRGVRNLINLALTSPLDVRPKLTFISSVSVMQNDFHEQPIPERSANIVEAVGTGYSESKWVAEHLFEKASSLGLAVDVIRAGQLCGGVNGCWNAREWIPAMICSAKILGYIPDVEKDIALLRVSDAGKAVNDYRISQPNAGLRFLHLVQPRPLSWSSLAQAIASILNVSLVDYGAWLACLAACPVQVPASHLLGFYERDFDPSAQDAFGMARFDCSLALANSDSLRACESDLTEDVGKWIASWEAGRE